MQVHCVHIHFQTLFTKNTLHRYSREFAATFWWAIRSSLEPFFCTPTLHGCSTGGKRRFNRSIFVQLSVHTVGLLHGPSVSGPGAQLQQCNGKLCCHWFPLLWMLKYYLSKHCKRGVFSLYQISSEINTSHKQGSTEELQCKTYIFMFQCFGCLKF